jgi:NAD(P)-dependent dehydrogenase (short-subunit alcohol dehydrogenase family)
MRLDGKRAIVTGGAGGIGSAIAKRMAEAGAQITIADLDEEKARGIAAGLGSLHFSAKVDVASLESVDAMVARAEPT